MIHTSKNYYVLTGRYTGTAQGTPLFKIGDMLEVVTKIKIEDGKTIILCDMRIGDNVTVCSLEQVDDFLSNVTHEEVSWELLYLQRNIDDPCVGDIIIPYNSCDDDSPEYVVYHKEHDNVLKCINEQGEEIATHMDNVVIHEHVDNRLFKRLLG